MPEPASLRPHGATAEPVPDVRGRRILVVEDEYMLAEDLRLELEDAGAVVLGPAPSVADALALLADAEGGPPDAAILDLNLGGEMAYPVADALRERGVPVMLATGYDVQSIPAAYADVPRCEKPFDVGRCLSELFGST